MSLPNRLFAPSFKRQKTSLLFASIIGFMVFAATFAIAMEATLSSLSLNWDHTLENRLTVEIPAVEDESSLPQTERIRQILAILKATPGVTEARLLADDETLSLLKPWIEDASILHTLPIPNLIDVVPTDGTHLNANEIRDHLKPIARDVRVDDHASWMSDLQNLIRGLVLMTGIMALLAILTLAVTVALFCRAVISSETDTIAILHVMGAEDHDIAKHFQLLTLRLSLPTAFLGFTAALMAVTTLLYFISSFADLSILTAIEWVFLIAVVSMVPLLAMLITALSARLAVINSLRIIP